MLQFVATGSMVLSLLGSPLVIEPVAPPTDPIKIDIVTVNGSGCPIGTAAVAVSPDKQAFTVTYSDYIALTGLGAGTLDSRKNCQLVVQVHVPTGFTYGIVQADYRGYAQLSPGARGTEKASYYFQGMSATSSASHVFSGPYDDNWQATDVAEIGSVSYMPCGEQKYLNINTEIRVSPGPTDSAKTTTSMMAVDSSDVDLSTIYHFSWMKCPIKKS